MSFVENSSWELLFWPTSKSYWKPHKKSDFYHSHTMWNCFNLADTLKGSGVQSWSNKTFLKWKISPPSMFCFDYLWCEVQLTYRYFFGYSTRGTKEQPLINTREISICDLSFILGIVPSIESQPSVKRFHLEQQRQSFYFRWAEEKHHDCFKLKICFIWTVGT